MKKLFTFLLGALVCTVAMAVQPSGVIKKTDVAPVIGGDIDEVWATANVYNIATNFQTEVPTLGAEGEVTWQALWDDKGVYILLKVTDDVWYPNYAVTPAGNNWEYDKPEIYFDVNYELKDGIGAGGNAGHYQVAPGFTDGKNDGTAIHDANNFDYAFTVTEPNYTAEYFIPWAKLNDKDGVNVDKTGTIGFDVTIIDRDAQTPTRQRANWANAGAINEDYNNMDDAGLVTFEGAEAGVYVDAVNVTGGAISTDGGTLQLTAAIEPVDASNQILKWSIVEGAGLAKISNDGLVTALKDGVITVKAAATDGGWAEGTATVTITGQTVSKDDVWNSLNLLSNFDFATDMTNWTSGWIDGAQSGDAPVSVDGVATLVTHVMPEVWHYQFVQSGFKATPNVPYLIKFKAWASADRNINFDFESSGSADLYSRYGTSTDVESTGSSEWTFPVTTDPTWFTFHVNFDKMVPTTGEKIQFMLSSYESTVYLDSMLLITEEDYALAGTSTKSLSNVGSMKVYPSPVGAGNELNVRLTAATSKVAIYNSVGQKLMEKVATSDLVKFNVSSLRKGMYFVRLDDGTSQKFIK